MSRLGVKRLGPLLKGLKRTGGRNNSGKVTVRSRGGGHKRSYRYVDYKRNIYGVYAKVIRMEYCPFRSSKIAVVAYSNGYLAYILSPLGLYQTDWILTNPYLCKGFNVGDCAQIGNFYKGVYVHNIEDVPGEGGKYIRAGGTSGLVVGNYPLDGIDGSVLVKLASGEYKLFNAKCYCTVGILANKGRSLPISPRLERRTGPGLKFKLSLRKAAGLSRRLGRRPRVRGVAMNPIDHPHGGGEGKTSGGRPSVSLWGYKGKGPRTRKKPLTDSIAKRRRDPFDYMARRLRMCSYSRPIPKNKKPKPW